MATVTMKFSAILALVSAALAAPTSRDARPIDVALELIGNSGIKAVVTNTGETSIKVLKTGSILSGAPIEKAKVWKNDKEIAFDGVRIIVLAENLDEDAFQVIAAGESVEASFDVAELHDLSEGGKFKINVSGAFQYAEDDSTTATGSVNFDTVSLEVDVDGEQASLARLNFLEKRTRIQADCTGTRLTALRNAVAGCATLARNGQNAANNGAAAKLTEFYKSSTASTRSTVAAVFGRAVTECSSPTSGVSASYCTDVYGNTCNGGVIAYTLPSGSYMAYCPSFFSSLPATSNSCYGPSQAFVVLHEATHLSQIGGTDDFSCYGYQCLRGLSASQNIRHADTYSTFAQAVTNGC
ncbi:Neutral protease [Paramyrothecium foliicola]|nr:Neutral protease [Paramyrothecium foliicola]